MIGNNSNLERPCDDFPRKTLLTQSLEFSNFNSSRQNSNGQLGAPSKVFPVAVRYSNLTYKIPCANNSEKIILQNISGYAFPGEILAILGPSGCGKSSLLNVLSGRIPAKHSLTGSLSINNQRLTKSFAKRLLGYVMQDNLMFTKQTVYETLKFSADLRLPSEISEEDRIRKVKEVIEDLGLKKVQYTYIGDELHRGISGGEKKRVSIGQELVREISILLLDEPTSGLDAAMAFHVVEILKSLAVDRGMTIICTIHQPRSQIWNLFDKILLLSEGKEIYYGPSYAVLDFFSSAGFNCPEYYNPADFLLDTCSIDFRTEETEISSRSKLTEMVNRNIIYSESAKFVQDFQDELKWSENLNTTEEIPKAPFHKQMRVLFIRSFSERLRDRIVTYARLLTQIFMALLLGGIYFNLGLDQKSIQDRSGLLFFIVVNQVRHR